MINYNGKKFKIISTSDNSELDTEFVFEYVQRGKVLQCTYSSNSIQAGNILGTVDESGNISLVYHQINRKGEIKTGTCYSKPELLPNGKIRLYEK